MKIKDSPSSTRLARCCCSPLLPTAAPIRPIISERSRSTVVHHSQKPIGGNPGRSSRKSNDAMTSHEDITSQARQEVDPRRRDDSKSSAIVHHSRSRHNADRSRHDRDQMNETTTSHQVSSRRKARDDKGWIQPHKCEHASSESHPHINVVGDSNRNENASLNMEFRKAP